MKHNKIYLRAVREKQRESGEILSRAKLQIRLAIYSVLKAKLKEMISD